MKRPGKTQGLRHIALFVPDLVAAEHFFVDLMGMTIEWRPDPDNVYLTSGNDNLALHQVEAVDGQGSLDHIGFFINDPDEVQAWFEFLQASGVETLPLYPVILLVVQCIVDFVGLEDTVGALGARLLVALWNYVVRVDLVNSGHRVLSDRSMSTMTRSRDSRRTHALCESFGPRRHQRLIQPCRLC